MMADYKYFESQQDDEQVILVVRRHFFDLIPAISIGLLVYFVLFSAMIFIPIYIPTLVTGPFYNIFILIISIFFLFNTTFLFNTWLLHYLHIAVLTTEHFVEINQFNVFSRKISEMGLDKVQDVSASQRGIFATMFNFGDIDLETAGELPNFNLEFVGNPNMISKKIMEIEEEYSRRHGIRGDGISGNANMVNNTPSVNQEGAPEVKPKEPVEYATSFEQPAQNPDIQSGDNNSEENLPQNDKNVVE